MELISLFLTSFYFFFVVLIFSGLLFRNKLKTNIDNLDKVSVVVAARNEGKNIHYLLDDLIEQSLINDDFEVIIANDRSEDNTKDILSDYSSKHSFIKVINITQKTNMAPKKYALSKAIDISTGEIIITTDADCRVPKNWAENMAKLVQHTGRVVVGYSKIKKPNNIISQYQRLDFLGIMAANAGLLTHGIICSGSGQNLGFKKKDFFLVGGFEPVESNISGDDMYIVQSISKIKGAIFNYDPNSFVFTNSKNTIGGYINQRIRWSSNSKHTIVSSPVFFMFLFSAFITNFIILVSLLLKYEIALFLILIKFCSEGLIILISSKIFMTSSSLLSYIIWNFSQPIYIPIIGLYGLFDKYSWKK